MSRHRGERESDCEELFSKGNNKIYLREEEPGGGQGVGGWEGGRACRNLNFQTYGGGAARASQTQTKSFSLNFMYFGCYPWLFPAAQRGSDTFLSFLSLGLCFAAWTDGQTGWPGLPGERKGLPLHLESILTQQHIRLTSDLPRIVSFPPKVRFRPFKCPQRPSYLSPGLYEP